MKKPVVLMILDGYGIAPKSEYNAISMANTPNMDKLFATYPNILLEASGEAVGLPEGQMGNSEVGHQNIGAGRTIYQSLTRVNVSIKNKTFFENEEFLRAIRHVKDNNSKLHIYGLLSDGGVHSHINHFKAMLDLAKSNGVNTYVHGFMDGRDTPPQSGLDFVKDLQNYMDSIEFGKFATISGRYYVMDRDSNYDRTKLAYDAMVNGVGECASSAVKAMEQSYAEGITDEFVKPTVVDEAGLIADNDAVIFLNFRPDRAIQISTMLTNMDHDVVTVKSNKVENLYYVCLMTYADYVKGQIAFGLENYSNLYGEVIANNGLKQLRIAETEKYAHVTFFFDGGKDIELEGSTRVLVNSPKVATYDLQPEMSAYEVCDKMLAELDKDYDTVILNFANCDMVGHTGVITAAIKAVEVVDECVGKVVEKVVSLGGVCLITADHGNADKMANADGSPFTAHTTNLVPLILTSNDYDLMDKTGALADLAPTMLDLLNVEKPAEMTGESLIKK